MKKKDNTMNKVLVVIAVTLIVFTIAMIATYWHIGGVPDTLITAVFGACLGEFGFMAWIKNTNTKNKNGGNENADDYDAADPEFSNDDTVYRGN